MRFWRAPVLKPPGATERARRSGTVGRQTGKYDEEAPVLNAIVVPGPERLFTLSQVSPNTEYPSTTSQLYVKGIPLSIDRS
jgi:hypothetical protein